MPARSDETGNAKASEVHGDVVLALTEHRSHLADAMWAVGEYPQDPRPRTVADQRRCSDCLIDIGRRQVQA